MIGSYKDITHETHTIIFTNSRKRASGFTPGVFQGMYFEVFISFVHCFGIIIKEKCSPFNQGIIQQPIMYINKVIIPMTELSEPPSYLNPKFQASSSFLCLCRPVCVGHVRKPHCWFSHEAAHIISFSPMTVFSLKDLCAMHIITTFRQAKINCLSYQLKVQ